MARKRLFIVVGAALGIVTLLTGVLTLARRERTSPERCPSGLVDAGSRCCGADQRDSGGACEGAPRTCAAGMTLTQQGCVARTTRVALQGGTFQVGSADWEPNMSTEKRVVSLQGFRIDSHEVTLARWQRCVATKQCPARQGEPGQPVRSVSAAEAARFCTFEGGKLPSVDQWLVAAMGNDERRFPWGPTGLVCRRASFGLVAGPCANGGTNPELAGARPDGATPDGVQDLAGNVAEWARQPDGGFVALGGSFASRLAAELKAGARPVADPPPEQVGFRCVYQ